MRVWLFLHIAGGSLAVVAGYAALFAPKGQWLHRRAGLLFVWGMLALGAGATVVGLAHDKATWLGGPVVAYYVLTGLRTVRRGGGPATGTDLALTGLGVAIAITSLTLTVMDLMSPSGALPNVPLPLRVMSPALLLLAVRGDLLVRRSGPLTGNRRLWRHLWRMCYAMFAATGSFFLGQPKFIPEPLRNWPLRITLAVLPLVMLFYWMWRVRRGRNVAAPTLSLGALPHPRSEPVI